MKPSATHAPPSPTATTTALPTPTVRATATTAPIVLSRGAAAGKIVAFTFDCGSDRGNAPAILTYLQRQGIAATFGVTGRWAELNPDLVRRMALDGHQIINHTYDHTSFTGYSTKTQPLTADEIQAELEKADAVIQHITGNSTRPYFRPPYGDESDASRHAAAADGYSIDVLWSLDSLGWTGLPAARIVSRVLDATDRGSIVLMHVGAASQDAQALPRIVDGLRARGYRFVSVAALLRGGTPQARALAHTATFRAADPYAAYYPASAPGPLSGHVVFLDPGHGGNDPGTCYPYTYNCDPTSGAGSHPVMTEQAATLDIALYHLLPRLHLLGADVYLTRTTLDQNPSLEQRLQLANDVARSSSMRRHALYISIHLNGSEETLTDYSLALYAAHRPQTLARALADSFGATLDPPPLGGNHDVDTYPGHVLRHNVLPATIVEPAFLTNAFEVAATISTTKMITVTSGAALRRGITLYAPIVTVKVKRRGSAGKVETTARMSFSGRPPLDAAITLARTSAISAFLDAPSRSYITMAAPLTPTLADPPAVPTGLRYTIQVSGAVSTTTAITTTQGEGPWLTQAHLRARRSNRQYDALLPTVLSLAYPPTDREERIAQALLRGIASFFHVAVPARSLLPRQAYVELTPVVPPG